MDACLRKITLEKSFYRFPLAAVMRYIAFDVVKSAPQTPLPLKPIKWFSGRGSKPAHLFILPFLLLSDVSTRTPSRIM